MSTRHTNPTAPVLRIAPLAALFALTHVIGCNPLQETKPEPPAAASRPAESTTAPAASQPTTIPTTASQPTNLVDAAGDPSPSVAPPKPAPEKPKPAEPRRPDAGGWAVFKEAFNEDADATCVAKVSGGNTLTVNTDNISRLTLDFEKLPENLRRHGPWNLQIDNQGIEVTGARGRYLHLVRGKAGAWDVDRAAYPPKPAPTPKKKG